MSTATTPASIENITVGILIAEHPMDATRATVRGITDRGRAALETLYGDGVHVASVDKSELPAIAEKIETLYADMLEAENETRASAVVDQCHAMRGWLDDITAMIDEHFGIDPENTTVENVTAVRHVAHYVAEAHRFGRSMMPAGKF